MDTTDLHQWMYDVYIMYRWLEKLVSGELSTNIKVFQKYRFGWGGHMSR